MKNKTNISVRDNLGARVIPDLILGSDGPYVSADILDANAVDKRIGERIEYLNSKLDAPTVAGTEGQILALNSEEETQWVTPNYISSPDTAGTDG